MSARATDREILQLAIPALGALAAEPLYILVDTAVVGHLGAQALAGLAVGSLILTDASWLLNFLAYGTTARAARRFGAGDRAAAVGIGAQATLLALALGVVLTIGLELVAAPLIALIAGGDQEIQREALGWLRIAALGTPAILLSLAGQGWMRGIQDVRRPLVYLLGANALSAAASPLLVYGLGLGLEGSAIANALAQYVAAALFVAALLRERPSFQPDRRELSAQLRAGRDLAIRTLALQVSFATATALAARLGATRVAAHQIAIQLFLFIALTLDALAIAAQQLVGSALGAGDAGGARATGRRIVVLGAYAGCGFAAVLLAGWTLIPALFTNDAAVVDQAQVVWPLFAAIQPACGAVFALDGILIGASDNAFLRNVTIAASLGGFLPVTLAGYLLGLGLIGIWLGLAAFIGVRLVLCLYRFAGGRWAVVGAPAVA